MTAEPGLLTSSPAASGRVRFLATLDPLPLLDPTEAAHFLGLRRHSLACYRSLGSGPPYYKFGRWIRYARSDLRCWSGGAKVKIGPWTGKDDHEVVDLVDTDVAAHYLTVTRFCLRNYRLEGHGPRYCRLGRRIHYPVNELRRWAMLQRQPALTLDHF